MTSRGFSPSRLRSLKSNLVGHTTRKTELIRDGLLPSLRTILLAEDSQQLLCFDIVGLVASEGPVYVGPILESELILLFLQRLSRAPPPRETLVILKALDTIALNLPSRPGQWTQDTRLADLLYDPSITSALVQNVGQASETPVSQQICDYTLAVICKTCKTEKQKRILVEQGLLNVLAHRLASFVVSEGLVVPSLEALDFPSSAATTLPGPFPPYAHLSPVLETIGLLISNSKEWIDLFLNNPYILTVLPQPRDDFSPTDIRQAPWGTSAFSRPSLSRPRHRNAFDGLLAVLPSKEKTNNASHLNFPPLGSGGPASRRRPSFQPGNNSSSALHIIPENQDEKDERTVVPFLLFLARESRGKRRFLACRLLVILATHNYVPTTRLCSFSGLLVPILVKMLDADEPIFDDDKAPAALMLCDGTYYKKAIPAILAELIRDHQNLQKVAVEAKAIVKLSVGLRSTFLTPSGHRIRMWRQFKLTKKEIQSSSPDCTLGHGGPSCTLRQDMAYREGALRALAAIAAFDDEYRKQICDQGALVEIMLALAPFDLQPRNDESDEETIGNSASTILAACGAVRALTRSVTALRTKLVDAEVAKTVIKLMNSTNLEVRIAVTQVLTNLAMDFSPMKDSVGDSAVVKKLCEQAHSANARLRLESIWALKQLVVNAPKKLKQEVFNELGSSWIKLLIRTDPYDIPEGEVIGLVDRDYPPRASHHYTSEDVIMSEGSDGEDSVSYADTPSEHMPDIEDDFDRHTPEDDLAIQEQVLDLIRNMFVTSTMSETAAELVDYVLHEMGMEEFFHIMKTRISPKTVYGPTRKDNLTTPPPAGIVTRVLYIILHIAACSQKWRTVIASEQDLLKRILGYSNHAEREVRANCCWLAINLMFDDEGSDRASCRRRANELSKIGYRMHLQKLENDPDLDVRERAKTAMTLFSTLLDQK